MITLYSLLVIISIISYVRINTKCKEQGKNFRLSEENTIIETLCLLFGLFVTAGIALTVVVYFIFKYLP